MSLATCSTHPGAGANLIHVDVAVNHSELFRGDCKRLILEADKASQHMQEDTNNYLYQRVKDIEFMKKELELKLDETNQEIEELEALHGRVTRALVGTQEPLRVAILCLEERAKRFPSERLYDVVDAALRKERDTIESVAALLMRVLEQLTEQIRLSRSAKYHLERDMKEKFEAECIDNSCAIMTVHSVSTMQPHNVDGTLSSLSVTPKQWENISDINIAKAEQQKINSRALRALVESLLEQTALDLQNTLDATKAAFQANIQKLKTAKSQMEAELPKLLAEIAGQQRVREDLLVCIAKNQDALSLARAQLALRSQRPGKEQCHDLAQSQLLAEVQRLTAHIIRLQEEVAQSEKEQRSLIRCQLKLEEDIAMKTNSLYIDEVVCTQHREPIVIHKY